MAQDVFKPKGRTKYSKPDAGGAVTRNVPIIGIVKDNIDPTRQGRIFVYLTDSLNKDPNSRDSWVAVSYMTPFYGRTPTDANNDNYGTYKTNPSSYGMWNSPPDIGSKVICIFVNGDVNYGYYIGCVPEPEALQMVPAIGATDNIVANNEGEGAGYGGALRLPVSNINTNNKGIADSADYIKAPKPIHSYVATIMNQQGLLRDMIRGPISSSSQRETPSRVGWGVSTPGRPIYEGGYDDNTIAQNLNKNNNKSLRVVSRRGGHSIVMDDGDIIGQDNLVRIRSSLGHQILMSDDGQTLFIIHSNGQSYVELGKEGTVDIYSTNSVNVRTQGDLNLHADRDVNIHAKKNLRLQAESIHINSEKDFKQKVGTDYKNFTMGKHLTKVNGAMSMESGGDISMASGAQAYVNGSKVLLNSGQTSTKPEIVPAIQMKAHTDTLHDAKKGFLAAPGKLLSITSRAPAHTPWANANKGVDVKVELGAGGALPSKPSTPITAGNQAAAASNGKQTTASTNATAPPSKPVSQSITKNPTAALVGQAASQANTSPFASAAQKGTAIVNTVKKAGGP